MGRLTDLKKAGRQFDLEFWQKATAEQRFAAAWEMTLTYMSMRGMSEDQSRLQKSVQNIEYLPRPLPRRRRARRNAVR